MKFIKVQKIWTLLGFIIVPAIASAMTCVQAQNLGQAIIDENIFSPAIEIRNMLQVLDSERKLGEKNDWPRSSLEDFSKLAKNFDVSIDAFKESYLNAVEEMKKILVHQLIEMTAKAIKGNLKSGNSLVFTVGEKQLDLKGIKTGEIESQLAGYYRATGKLDLNRLQLAVLIGARRIFDEAKAMNTHSNKAPNLTKLIQTHFPLDLVPDQKAALRLLISENQSPMSSCCGGGCAGCRTFVKLEAIMRIQEVPNNLPLTDIIRKKMELDD